MKISKAQYKYAIRRLKQSASQIQNNKFLEKFVFGTSGDIFKEIKKFRGEHKTVSSRIDNEVGGQNIANHFADKYNALYGRSMLGNDLNGLKTDIENSLNDEDHLEVLKIDENIVKAAAKRMKGGKADVAFSFSSDCLVNGTDNLYRHLATLFRAFLFDRLQSSYYCVPWYLLSKMEWETTHQAITIEQLQSLHWFLSSLTGLCCCCKVKSFQVISCSLVTNV